VGFSIRPQFLQRIGGEWQWDITVGESSGWPWHRFSLALACLQKNYFKRQTLEAVSSFSLSSVARLAFDRGIFLGSIRRTTVDTTYQYCTTDFGGAPSYARKQRHDFRVGLVQIYNWDYFSGKLSVDLV
jgi:hypothetical protein